MTKKQTLKQIQEDITNRAHKYATKKLWLKYQIRYSTTLAHSQDYSEWMVHYISTEYAKLQQEIDKHNEETQCRNFK